MPENTVPTRFLDLVQASAHKRILFLPHAIDEMNAPDELITPVEVRAVIFHGEIVEDYSEDKRGHSCLMLGFGTDGRPIHVVCSPKQDHLTIITVYLPDPQRWQDNWKTRRVRS
jgi:hypothetical protein